ncbi:hypothetical protein AGABI2DRAFT_122425 [Agaricus bisporus var. bisporus H97]|uniref:hypothetical protein n=1 Tax=Agaricus bisporus var. bisporus (strain H97 / ATCC MYA-4626 / FGSC 10389) TaxID=936046 RepID=UPI00029F79F7|nr:hypothetical protein AGABI2DRAFT_122425 [Agaricus bisporus var. bisporus H97]EKV42842.1 hypothetical protein AGABI2DRAFT_122425 [Agaricus bisporus var. bisporus H97]
MSVIYKDLLTKLWPKNLGTRSSYWSNAMVDVPGPGPATSALNTGPPMVGIILNWWLFGILVMQYIMYCSYSASKDKKILQIVVHLLFALDTAQAILTMVDAFNWFVYGFGNVEALLEFGTASIDSPFMDGLIAFIVQMVYCWRVRVLSKSTVIPALIAFFAFVGGASGIFLGIYDAVVVRRLTNIKPSLTAPVMLWLWSSAVTDLLIASSMTYLLLKLRPYGLRTKTVTLMKRVLILSLETNFLTTAVAMASAMMFVLPPIAPPRTNVYLTGGYVIGKLYSNCFMVLLNQRIRRDNRGLEYGASHELGVVYTSAISDSTATASKNNSKLTHPKVESANIGELSNMQFAEPPVRVQFGGEGKASESLASGFNPASEATRPSVGK